MPHSNHGFLIISTLGVKQRAVIMTLLYRKSLRLSNAARQESSVGQIVNLMSNDANRFPEFSMFVSHINPSPALRRPKPTALGLSAAQRFWLRPFSLRLSPLTCF